MSNYLEVIQQQWRERAKELAAWAMAHMVNRTDVWGRYLAKKYRRVSPGGRENHAITAPFKDERGKVFLQESSLEKHFKAKHGGQVLGLHCTAADRSCRWLAIDVDLHEEDDLSVSREGNFAAGLGWWEALQSYGLDPILIDSNGAGGHHIMVMFSEPMSADSVNTFCRQLVSDFERRGLDQAPDLFPSKNESPTFHYGKWLRLFGRHHTRDHFTRVWNDEPMAEDKWLAGHDAIDRILGTALATPEQLEKIGVTKLRKVVCIEFDGVIHMNHSAWVSEALISDQPILRAQESIAMLRNTYDVVVHSKRCRTAEGRAAIANWLASHDIEVDGIREHKPDAHIYLDHRGLAFDGNWEETISAIHAFRR